MVDLPPLALAHIKVNAQTQRLQVKILFCPPSTVFLGGEPRRSLQIVLQVCKKCIVVNIFAWWWVGRFPCLLLPYGCRGFHGADNLIRRFRVTELYIVAFIYFSGRTDPVELELVQAAW